MSGAQHSAESVMHYTPRDIVERARATLGSFMLDPAGDAFSNLVVGAAAVYEREGLVRPWHGPVFVNPPGRSDDNPGGASAWWHKLVAEWDAGNKSWSAIFVGFSLEILQTCQSKSYRHPLSFPTCVPKQRIKFDVNAAELRTQLARQLACVAPGTPKHTKLSTKLAKVDAALKRGERRYPGDAPPHGNFVTCVAHDLAVTQRFYTAFADLGMCQ